MASQAFSCFGTENDEISMRLFGHSQDFYGGIALFHAKQWKTFEIGGGREQLLQLVNDRLLLIRMLLNVQESDSRMVFLGERKGILGLAFRALPESGCK